MSRKPYKCPVCEGTGKVDGTNTYGAEEGICSEFRTEDCRACDGKGIVWEPKDNDIHPYIPKLPTTCPFTCPYLNPYPPYKFTYNDWSEITSVGDSIEIDGSNIDPNFNTNTNTGCDSCTHKKEDK